MNLFEGRLHAWPLLSSSWRIEVCGMPCPNQSWELRCMILEKVEHLSYVTIGVDRLVRATSGN